MDIKAKIEEVVNKVSSDPNFAQNFKSNPMEAVKSIIGQGVPDDTIQQVVNGVKAQTAGQQAGDVMGNIKSMF